MGDISRFENGHGHKVSEHGDNALTCPVCSGRKYTLVATRRVNRMSTVYERQDCHICVVVHKSPAVEESNTPTKRSNRKRLSGTGYLRNKKRRRKEDD
jgi:hypothetical protein